MSIDARLRDLLAHRDEVVAAYLYGSHGRRTATSSSDVDIAVLFVEPPEGTLDDRAHRLQRELERELEREVDLLALHGAPPDLTHRVLRDGHLVCERDKSRRIAFEIRARNEYFDLLPHLRRYRRSDVA